MSYNRVILVGNLTRDCELKYLQSGSAVATTGIATNRKFKNQNGEQKEEVMFIDLTFYGRTAEIANQFLKRGSKVLVEGKLRLDSWTDQNGNKKSKHSITVENLQMLGSKNENEPKVTYEDKPMHQQDDVPEIDIDEDEIPFSEV